MRLLHRVSVALIAFAVGVPAAHGAQLMRQRQNEARVKQKHKTKTKTKVKTTPWGTKATIIKKTKTRTKARVRTGSQLKAALGGSES